MSNIPKAFWDKVRKVSAEQGADENILILDGDEGLHLLERWRMERGLYRRVNREWRIKPKDISPFITPPLL